MTLGSQSRQRTAAFGEYEGEALGRIVEGGLTVETLGDGLGMVAGEVGEARPGVLGYLEQACDHERQEEADVLAIGFKCGQLALLLVQAPLKRGSHVLKLGVGEPGQSHTAPGRETLAGQPGRFAGFAQS